VLLGKLYRVSRLSQSAAERRQNCFFSAARQAKKALTLILPQNSRVGKSRFSKNTILP
jgi:hypothetical protein